MSSSEISTLCEALMMLCFALSWPFSIAKALRTKIVAGKSPVFMTAVIIGYIMGIIHKIIDGFDWVTYIYIFNTTIVSIDLFLYFHYSKLKR